MPAIESRAPWRRRRVVGRDIEMNAKEWITAYAEELGTRPPSAEEFELLLDLAGVAAHSSERVAAPVSCWVAANAGVTPEQALVAARKLADAGDQATTMGSGDERG